MAVLKKLLIALIRGYQIILSPWLGSNCRHDPTCSQYAIQALEIWGVWRGIGLTIRRVGKCHPWGTQGHDPVPSPETKRVERTDDPL